MTIVQLGWGHTKVVALSITRPLCGRQQYLIVRAAQVTKVSANILKHSDFTL